MFTVHATKKLLDRVKTPIEAPVGEPSTTLGNWYATALFWKPQVALFVNETTLLPVLVPLAPAKALIDRFPTELERVLTALDIDPDFVSAEVAATTEGRYAKTANRSVVGSMNEFSFFAEVHRDHGYADDLVGLAVRLAGMPCGPLRQSEGFPDRQLRALVTASTGRPTPIPARDATLAVKRGATATVHQLKITLNGIRPPVWRRVLISSSSTLADLHRLVQDSMGWWNYHLHEFRVGRVVYGTPDDEDFGKPDKDEADAVLDKVAPKGSRLRYEYDFGDGWEHQIQVEDVVPAEADTSYPRCIAGRRNCPPEDVGGPGGYDELLEALADPTHDRHSELLDWIGGTFDPEHFDLDETNDRIVLGGQGVFDLD